MMTALTQIITIIGQLCLQLVCVWPSKPTYAPKATTDCSIRRKLLMALLLLLIVGVTVVSGDSVASFKKLRRDHGVKTSTNNDSHSGKYDDDDDDSDEDDDDDEDDERADGDDRVRNAIVGAVPALLGLLAIIVLCIFMLCGRRRKSQRSKWDSRHQLDLQYLPRSNQSNHSVTADDGQDVDSDDTWSHNYRSTTPITMAAVHSPVPTYDQVCGQQSQRNEDSPPSYEEVMRNINRPA